MCEANAVEQDVLGVLDGEAVESAGWFFVFVPAVLISSEVTVP